MRVAMYHGEGRLTIEQMPDPSAGPGELVVRMTACGLCGSDLMRWYQDPRAPVVLGHEPVGVVVQAGNGARFDVGQRVYIHHHVPCFTCALCRAGRHTLCERFRSSRINPGGLAELIHVPAENVRADVLLLPDAVDDEAATLIEPLGCIVRGQHRARVGHGSRVVIVGAGSMGLLQIPVALALGATTVMVVEPDDDRRARAEALGAEVSADLSADAVRLAFDGDLATQVIVCTHNQDAIAGALDLADAAGVVQLFAPTRPGDLVPLDLGSVWFREVELQSTYSAGPFDTREALFLLQNGCIDASSVITHRFALEDAQEAYRLADEGIALKVVVRAAEEM